MSCARLNEPCCLQVKTMSQDIRNDVGSLLLRLTIRELFDWRFMQTDPNWGNFLYDEHSDQLHLIDFGAAKEYPKPFVDDYLRMVLACADKNREELIQRSTKLKFLTGQQLSAMLYCWLLYRRHGSCLVSTATCQSLFDLDLSLYTEALALVWQVMNPK